MSKHIHTSIPELVPLKEAFKSSAAYWGERGDWLIAYTTTRDADCLARSNWECFVELLTGQSAHTGAKGSSDLTDCVAIEEASHWAVGWVQYLIIRPDAAEQIAEARAARADLENYPVLNDTHYSNLEYEEYGKFFKSDARFEFKHALRAFELSDAALGLIESAPLDRLLEWFESRIPSGEYQDDGYPCFDLAFRNIERAEVGQMLRTLKYGTFQS